MRRAGFILAGIFCALFTACENAVVPEQEVEQEMVNTDELDSLIGVVQIELITKLTGTIEEKGLVAAAEFCSSHAQHLTDSLSEVLGYSIRRVSDKHRNPKNSLDTYDLEVMQAFRVSKEAGNMSMAQLNNANKTYYKPILLGMPVCLKCHGTVQDRDAEAYEVIRRVYPADLAIDYELGDLRGMWVMKY